MRVQDASNAAESVAKQTRAFEDQLPALQALNAAYHENAQAVRDAQVGVKVAQFKTQNPFASDDTIKAFATEQKRESDEAYIATVHQEAARYDLIKTYDNEVEHLNELKAVLESYGADTLAIEAAIDEAQTKEIEGWDKIALKFGDIGDKFRAMVNEIELQGDNFGEKVFGTLSKSIDGISGQLAKLIVTGKSSFKQFFQGIEEELIKAQLQKGFTLLFTKYLGGAGVPGKSSPFLDNLPLTKDGVTATPPFLPPGVAKPAGALGAIGKLFGLGGKRDGSSEGNALYVTLTNGGVGQPGAKGNPISQLLQSVTGEKGSPFGASGLDNLPLTNQNPESPQFLPNSFPGAPGAPGAGGATGIGGVASSIARVFGVGGNNPLGKPDGTSANPLYVQLSSGGGLTGTSQQAGVGGILGDLFGKKNTDSSSPFGASGLDNLPLFNLSGAANNSPFGASGLDNLPLFNTNSGDSSSGDSGSGAGGIISAISGLTSSLGNSGGRPTGSQANPFYVISAAGGGKGALGTFLGIASSIVGVVGAAKGGSAGVGTGGGDFLGGAATGGLIRGPGTSTSDSIPRWLSDGEFVVKADAVRNFGVKNLETINSLSHKLPRNFTHSIPNFGGFREMGGDVTPGKAYIVGEKRPELFIPKTAGTIMPSVNTKGGGDQSLPHHNQHAHSRRSGCRLVQAIAVSGDGRGLSLRRAAARAK